MDGLNSIASILTVFSQISVSLVSIIGFLALVFKPVRRLIVYIYKCITGNKDKNEKVLSKINELEQTFTSRVDSLENTLSKKIQEVSNINDENEKDRIRWEILSFANSCRNGKKHSKEEYNHIIELKVKYTNLLNKTGDKNGVFEEDYKYIEQLYRERLEKNDFLS